jgi:hypothetical protein
MTGIPSHLLIPLRQALADCEPLETNRSLRNLFADARLVPWRNSLPQADTLAERVDSLISYLHDKKHRDGSNALVSLLHVVAETIPDDGRPERLRSLAAQLGQPAPAPIRAEAPAPGNAGPIAAPEKTQGAGSNADSPAGEWDFFISYNRHDRDWGEWIAWQLEKAGYTTIIQAWDFLPGGNFAADMQRATEKSKRTIAVLSETYLTSKFAMSEWNAAFAQDPTGEQGLLLPIKVRPCNPKGLLSQIQYIDLTDVPQEQAVERLLTRVRHSRAKPSTEPRFPGTAEPPFPENT